VRRWRSPPHFDYAQRTALRLPLDLLFQVLLDYFPYEQAMLNGKDTPSMGWITFFCDKTSVFHFNCWMQGRELSVGPPLPIGGNGTSGAETASLKIKDVETAHIQKVVNLNNGNHPQTA
jgi:hypothetical protein